MAGWNQPGAARACDGCGPGCAARVLGDVPAVVRVHLPGRAAPRARDARAAHRRGAGRRSPRLSSASSPRSALLLARVVILPGGLAGGVAWAPLALAAAVCGPARAYAPRPALGARAGRARRPRPAGGRAGPERFAGSARGLEQRVDFRREHSRRAARPRTFSPWNSPSTMRPITNDGVDADALPARECHVGAHLGRLAAVAAAGLEPLDVEAEFAGDARRTVPTPSVPARRTAPGGTPRTCPVRRRSARRPRPARACACIGSGRSRSA